MKIQLLACFLLSLFTFCNDSGAASGSGSPVLTGKFENAANKTVLFEKLSANSITPLDTIELDENGNFTVNTPITEPGFYRVFSDQQNFVILVLDSSSRITLTGDLDNLPTTARVEGNKDSERLQELYAEMRRRDIYRDSLQMVLQNNANSPDVENIRLNLQKEYEANELKRKEYLNSYIKDDPSSLTSLIAISSLQYEEYPETYRLVNEKLPARYPDSELIVPFKQAYLEMTRTATGEVAPDIVMPTPSGETLKLSDLRGKYVLVDFWASWCKPCRVENPNVVKLYNEYKNKGFEILGVSLDRDKDAWVQAIQDDKLSWKHMSDLSFWNSPVVKAYSITGIPYTVLVDPEGKIIAKGLRGPALEVKLAEIFK